MLPKQAPSMIDYDPPAMAANIADTQYQSIREA